jgi:hypothetical protein
MRSKKVALNEITTAYNQMKEALDYYNNGICHFYKCIDFGKSNLDAEAIEFMNESNLKITKALALANCAPEIIESK